MVREEKQKEKEKTAISTSFFLCVGTQKQDIVSKRNIKETLKEKHRQKKRVKITKETFKNKETNKTIKNKPI